MVRRDWVRNPIDAFILAALEAKGLSPAPEADRRTLIRRVTFDLTGLPPTPEEIDAFLKDESPDAYEKVVDGLLARPEYGERWGRHWLDVVRFAESHGYEENTLRPNAWPYRDYVIRAFNEDIPYPRFVREQLAGDVAPGGDFLTRAATGYLVGGPHDMVGNGVPAEQLQQRMNDLADMVSLAGTTFLGLTVGCARCHDHKFDPITQRDFYGMQAVFAGVEHAERPIQSGDTEQRRREAAALCRPDAAGRPDRRTGAVSGRARRGAETAGRQPAPQRRTVPPYRGPLCPLHGRRHDGRLGAVHRRAGSVRPGRPVGRPGAGGTGRQGVGVVGLPEQPVPHGRTPHRRPRGQ